MLSSGKWPENDKALTSIKIYTFCIILAILTDGLLNLDLHG
jgi:hypothetical protein